MSDNEIERLTQKFEAWDAKQAKRDFLARMEKKLRHKERFSR